MAWFILIVLADVIAVFAVTKGGRGEGYYDGASSYVRLGRYGETPVYEPSRYAGGCSTNPSLTKFCSRSFCGCGKRGIEYAAPAYGCRRDAGKGR